MFLQIFNGMWKNVNCRKAFVIDIRYGCFQCKFLHNKNKSFSNTIHFMKEHNERVITPTGMFKFQFIYRFLNFQDTIRVIMTHLVIILGTKFLYRVVKLFNFFNRIKSIWLVNLFLFLCGMMTFTLIILRVKIFFMHKLCRDLCNGNAHIHCI